MNIDKTERVFQYVRLGEFENLKKEVKKDNVNDYINENQENLLQEAISSKSDEIIDYLLECKIDINHADKVGKTPLHYSAAHNDYETTKRLLKSPSIEVNKKDMHGNNPLWVATFNARGYYDIVALLKENGGNPNSKNNSNRSALDFAIQINDEELKNILTN
ncbi:ankyrin repeat domain-containing protein [Sphingobacterium paramultivorum]|uniref:ankyrin repeat domain-containing protein n=1 Tax=Sphingobacterium paramultivorum TaxID=2886510 RepID=UPI00129C1F27|nr:ankyrin repeat domain-containing protein [Sphingobacterium paramultivorum]